MTHTRLICIYTYEYMRGIGTVILTKKRKQRPLPGDDASTAEAASGRVGRDEQGEAGRANTTPNGGPHLELGRLRLKTWSKSDFSIAETWPTYLYMYLKCILYHGCVCPVERRMTNPVVFFVGGAHKPGCLYLCRRGSPSSFCHFPTPQHLKKTYLVINTPPPSF